jgi:hypothetical protein
MEDKEDLLDCDRQQQPSRFIHRNNSREERGSIDEAAMIEQKKLKAKRHKTKIDLAFPTVIINTSSHKKARRKKQWGFYRFIAGLTLCIILLFQFIHRTILRLPAGDKRLDFSNVHSIKQLSVDPIDSWCFAVSIARDFVVVLITFSFLYRKIDF